MAGDDTANIPSPAAAPEKTVDPLALDPAAETRSLASALDQPSSMMPRALALDPPGDTITDLLFDPFELLALFPFHPALPTLPPPSESFMEDLPTGEGFPASEPEPSCRICGGQPLPEQRLQLPCGCYFCDGCLERMFLIAMRDEESYPPRCHQRVISLNYARRHLPQTLVQTYRLKTLELTTPDKTYCSTIRCNAFIAPHNIHNGQAYCQQCQNITCDKCKERYHYGPCPTEGLLALLQALAKHERWQTCPKCKRLVEKIDGCDHMQCPCSCNFCYQCGKWLNMCVCEDDEVPERDDYLRRLVTPPRHRRPRTPVFRELEEDIIEDTLVAPFESAWEEDGDW